MRLDLFNLAAPLALILAGCGMQENGDFGVGEGERDEPAIVVGDDEALGAGEVGEPAEAADPLDTRARAAWERAADGVLVAQVSGTRDHPDVWGVVRLRPVGGQVEVESSFDALPAGTHAYHVHEHGDCSAPTQDSMGGHLRFQQLGMETAGTMRQPSRVAGGSELNEATGLRPGVVPGQGAHEVGPTDVVGGDAKPPVADPATQGLGHEGVGHEGVGQEGIAQEGVGQEGVGQEGVGQGGVGQEGAAMEQPSPVVDGNLGEIVAVNGSAEVTAIVPNLAPDDLPALVGRAVVVHERGNIADVPSGDSGTPIACGVIGVAAPGASIVPADQLEDDLPSDNLPEDNLPEDEATPPAG
jgi:Cu/Zn superoxide dismutase